MFNGFFLSEIDKRSKFKLIKTRKLKNESNGTQSVLQLNFIEALNEILWIEILKKEYATNIY